MPPLEFLLDNDVYATLNAGFDRAFNEHPFIAPSFTHETALASLSTISLGSTFEMAANNNYAPQPKAPFIPAAIPTSYVM